LFCLSWRPPPGACRLRVHPDEFPELLVPRFRPDNEVKQDNEVKHHITTSGPPLHARARRLDGEKLAITKAEFAEMEHLGIIRRSDSPWASPLHIAPKPGGGWRPCSNFQSLNNVTVDNRYPLPHIQEFDGGLVGKSIFSVVDLVPGFHHIPVHADNVCKTAIITPFGLYQFLRMPFGLKNAAQAFQRLMDGVLRGVDFVFVYLWPARPPKNILTTCAKSSACLPPTALSSTHARACLARRSSTTWATSSPPLALRPRPLKLRPSPMCLSVRPRWSCSISSAWSIYINGSCPYSRPS
jgi:hypothetical protein